MSNQLFTAEEIRIIRALQNEFPLLPEPYQEIARQLEITEERLLEVIGSLQERGCLKRLSIALRHNNVGYTINVMMVWDVEPERLAEVGEKVALHPRVTHCYDRTKVPEFDYNLYSMVHATNEEEYRALVEELKAIVQPIKYSELRTTDELKKIGMKYFVEDPYGGLYVSEKL